MPPIRPSVRHLYLLALFQLVGGPLVILAVVFFSRLVVQHAAGQGLKAGVTQAWQSPEWQKVATALSGAVTGHQKAGQQDQVPLGKEPTGKLVGLIWEQIDFPMEAQGPEPAPGKGVKRLFSAWPHAPPLPPPRCA